MVSPEDRAAYREAFFAVGQADPRLEEAYRALADRMVFPEHHPAHWRMIVDGLGSFFHKSVVFFYISFSIHTRNTLYLIHNFLI